MVPENLLDILNQVDDDFNELVDEDEDEEKPNEEGDDSEEDDIATDDELE